MTICRALSKTFITQRLASCGCHAIRSLPTKLGRDNSKLIWDFIAVGLRQTLSVWIRQSSIGHSSGGLLMKNFLPNFP
jgi:hypothetical protein